MLRFLRITGDSLAPDYQEGDFVLILTLPFFRHRLREGDVIVFRHAYYGTLIKRVLRVDAASGDVYVVGAHEGSLDSRRLGPIRRAMVLGRVLWHIRAPRRRV